MKRLLLLGAGHAHLQVLQAFAQEPPAGVTIGLIAPQGTAVYSGMVPGVLAGLYPPAAAEIPVDALCAAARVERLASSAVGMDAGARQVRTPDTVVGYDVLSIDTGAVPDRNAIPGAREHAVFVRPVDRFLALWPQIVALAAERPLSVAVVGGGAAGVEVALAVQRALGPRARVTVLTGGGPVLGVFSPRAQRLAAAALRRAAITVLDDTCVAVAADHLQLGGGARLQCDAPLVALGGAAPTWLTGSGLALDGDGFLATGATLQSTSHPEVFAAGDVAARQDRPVRRDGVQAVRAGAPLALNLRRFLGGGPLVPHLPPARSLALIALGERSAIACWGGLAVHGGWAWRWKDRIDRGWIARFAAPATPAPGSR